MMSQEDRESNDEAPYTDRQNPGGRLVLSRAVYLTISGTLIIKLVATDDKEPIKVDHRTNSFAVHLHFSAVKLLRLARRV